MRATSHVCSVTAGALNWRLCLSRFSRIIKLCSYQLNLRFSPPLPPPSIPHFVLHIFFFFSLSLSLFPSLFSLFKNWSGIFFKLLRICVYLSPSHSSMLLVQFSSRWYLWIGESPYVQVCQIDELPFVIFSRKFAECFFFELFPPPGDPWCDVLGIVSAVVFLTLHIYRDAKHL